MFNYAVCEILGKQYKVVPNKPLEVDYLGDLSASSRQEKKVEVQILLLSEDGKLTVGTPYLKDKLTLDYLDTIKVKKIRVAKFHAKANFRKVTGHRAKKARLVLSVKK